MTSTDAVDRVRFPRWLAKMGSPQASVLALILVAAAGGVGVAVDVGRSTAVARWHVYDTTWFLTLLGACGLHALAAAVIRLPWRRRDLGPVLIYLSVATLVAGQLQSQMGGMSGELVLREGESTDHFVRSQRTRITAVRQARPDEAPYQFAFDGGPKNWPAGRTLDLGEVDGVGARVLHYYAHAWPVVEWLDATPGTGGPSVRLNVTGPKGERVSEPQLIDDGLGEELFVGPLRIQLYRSTGSGMLDDFLHPSSRSAEALGPHGLLLAFHGDSITRIPVHENVGRSIPIGASGLQVELVAYLPNAKPDRLGHFSSAGDEPKNPVVELRVHEQRAEPQADDAREPLRQLAFAKSPLLNLDPVNGRPCPIKFRYYHPRIQPAPGLELLQDATGRLHARVASGGEYRVVGVVSRGKTLEIASGFSAEVAEHRPFVRQHVSWRPAEPADANAADPATAANGSTQSVPSVPFARRGTYSPSIDVPRPAMEVEFRAEGVVHKAWLQRDQQGLNQTVVDAPHGTLAVVCEADRVPLGFTVELAGVENADVTTNRAGFLASQLKLIDADGRSRPPRTIAPNHPVANGSFTLHQLDVQDVGHGKRTARLKVVSDPGRPYQYLGGLLLLIGAVVALVRYPHVRDVAMPQTSETTYESHDADASATNAPCRSRWSAAAAVLLSVTFGGPTFGGTLPGETTPGAKSNIASRPVQFEWQAWRQLPVFAGGRAQPLDTLAREFTRTTLTPASGRDPTTGETLEPTAVALAMLFEWSGWDHPSTDRLLLVKDARSEYFQFHEPDRWDNVPLLRVDDPALRSALGLDEQDRSVAPATLAKLTIEDPSGQDSRPLPFPAWAMVASERDRSGMPVTALERAGLELAERLWAYQDLRMGRQMAALPDGTGKWLSLQWLALTPFDGSTDPSGERRRAQQAFWAARRAYRSGDESGFSESSRGVLWAIRHDAARVSGYPSSRRMTWEIAYQRGNPNRVAWVLLTTACVAFTAAGVIKRRRTDWSSLARACHRWALPIYLVGMSTAVTAVGWRILIAGHAPVTSSYEMMVFAGTAAACLGAMLALRERSTGILGAAGAVAVLAIATADLGVGSLDATIYSADPAVRSNVWLTGRLLAVAIGYAALALAGGLAVLDLGRSMSLRGRIPLADDSADHEARDAAGRMIELAIRVGVGFSVVGLVSGCVWSDMATGRYWSWSFEEVVALLGLFPYVGLLLARRHQWLGDRGRSWAASAAFLALAACIFGF